MNAPAETLQRVVYALAARDAYRGVVRLDDDDLTQLKVRPGDIVALISAGNPQCKVALRVLPRLPNSDAPARQVGLDSLERNNAQLEVGDSVQLWKVSPPEAARVTLQPLHPLPRLGAEDLLEHLEGRALVTGNHVRLELYGKRAIDVRVHACEPADVVVVGRHTTLTMQSSSNAAPDSVGHSSVGHDNVGHVKSQPSYPVSSYDDIGGLTKEVNRVRELVELPLKRPDIFARLGIEAPKGVLLYGPPGTGKTLIAKAVAREAGAHFIAVAGPEIVGKYYGESEKRLRDIFAQASKNAPSIIFLDEIDAIGVKRSEVQGEVEKRVVAQLLTLLDGLSERGQVVVIGATNRPDDLDPALRRPGRFEREVAVGVPDRTARHAILQIHTRSMPLAEDVDLTDLAAQTHGFVGADLAALCREAGLERLRVALEPQTALDDLPELEVRRCDFRQALRYVSPSALREMSQDVAPAKWVDVGGLAAIKQELQALVELPFAHADLFATMQLEPPSGILLAGPPGTGKTLVARAIASEVSANFILVRAAQLLSKYVGESERAIRELFANARANAPTIVFFDEIDALLTQRGRSSDSVSERVIGQFLSEMDGALAVPGVLLLGATNRPEMLDPALLRSGRFESVLHFPLPQEDERVEILQVHLRGRPCAELDVVAIAAKTAGKSGADLERLCRRAALFALQASLPTANASSRPELRPEPRSEPMTEPRIEQTHLERALAELS